MNRQQLAVMEHIQAHGLAPSDSTTIVTWASERGYINQHEVGGLVVTPKGEEEMSWAGLSCCCGGGWRVGHRTDCPEAGQPEE